MISAFFARRIDDFKNWWHRPPTRKDRILGVVIGVVGGFWLGLIAGLVFIVTPAPLLTLLLWAAGGAAAGMVCGIFFPKLTSCICFPFSLIGIASN